MDFQKELNAIFEVIKDALPSGVEYTAYNIPSYSGRGSSGHSYFTLVDGKPNRENIPDVLKDDRDHRDIDINRRVSDLEFEITVAQEPGRFVVFSVSKEKGYTFRIAAPDELLQLAKYDLMACVDAGSRKEIFAEVVPDKKTGKPDVIGRQFIHKDNGESKEYGGAPTSDFARAAFHALDGKLKFVYAMVSPTDAVIKTNPEIPGVTELYEIHEDLSLDASKIENIYEFLESFSEAKIAIGLEALNANPDFKAKAEKRYGQFIKNRVGENAGLESFETAALTRKETDLFGDRHFAEDVISIARLKVEGCQAMIDFIGGLVMSHIDIQDYKKQAEATDNVGELNDLYFASAKKVKDGILAEANVYNKGWFGKISEMLANHRVEKLAFEKTDFTPKDNDALRAFIFYLDLNDGSELYFDIFQSYMEELTEFYWFLPNLPETSWGDTEMNLPKYTLKFPRKALYRIDDDGEWQTITPEPLASN